MRLRYGVPLADPRPASPAPGSSQFLCMSIVDNALLSPRTLYAYRIKTDLLAAGSSLRQ